MKLETSLILAMMGIFAAVEAAPHNSPDKEYNARISSTYYQALKKQLADIEAGVRIVDEQGGSSQPAAGRLEVFQDGKWTEPRKDDRDARISSPNYKALETEMADIELGVRFIEELDTSGESWKKLDELKEYKEGGRIEVFQEGEWQKICMIQNDFNAQVNAVNVICKMKMGSARAYGSTHSSHYFNQKTDDSGVSKHVFLCDREATNIFDCEKKEATCSDDWEATLCRA